MRATVTATCQHCAVEFTKFKKGHRPPPIYCSKKCFHESGFIVARQKAHAALSIKVGVEWNTGRSLRPRVRLHPRVYITKDQRCKQCAVVVPRNRGNFCNKKCHALWLQKKPVIPTQSPSWQREYAREIFANTCGRCGFNAIPEILQVHHVDYNPRNWANGNLLLLCPNCHETEHFITKTGRFNTAPRTKKERKDTYKFKKVVSDATYTIHHREG